ncbi:MAG: hypothetical protein Q9168_006557 [Polycauliona sp. 1 TL-2023]
MPASVIRQAVASITGFGCTASPPTDRQQSIHHTNAVDDESQSDNLLISASGPLNSMDHRPASPTGATATTPVTKNENTSAAHATKPQATAALVTARFVRPVETSPAAEFAFGKHVVPHINTKLTKGPVAALQKAAEQQSADRKPTPTSVRNVPSTGSIPPTSQSEKSLHDSDGSRVAQEPQGSYPQGTETMISEPLVQEVDTGTRALSDAGQEKTRQKPEVAAPYHLDAEDTGVTSKLSAKGASDRDRPADEEIGPAATDTHDSHHEENTTMIDGPTLVDEASDHDTASQASSKPSSRSPSLGRSLRSFGATISNRSFGQDNLDRSVLQGPKAASKVQKRRSSTGYRSLARSESQEMWTSESPVDDPDVLLKALTIHYHKQKQQRDELRAKEKEKDDEIADFKNIIMLLDGQLQESNQQLSSQEAKLLEYRQLIPGWQDKVKKLSNFVKGLSNDHARLRDDAQFIQHQQQKIRIHKDSLDKTLKQSLGALETERLYEQKRLAKAHHRTEMAEQALDSCNMELQGKNTSLQAEQERSSNYQASLDRFASNRGDILTKLADQESIIISKIASLDTTIADVVRNASAHAYEDPNPRLEMCISLLKEPPAVDPVCVDDVRKLDHSIQENGHMVSRLASLCHEHFTSTSHLEDRLVSEFESRLQSLVSTVKAGRPLEQQLQELHKVKATITERLQATEVQLTDSRHKSTAAEKQEKAQLQKAATLEAELKVLRAQAQEHKLTALSLHESEKQYEKLNAQAAAYQAQLEDIKSDQASRYLEKAGIEESLQAAMAETARLRSAVDKLASEKVSMENKAKLNEVRLREQYSTHCEAQISQNSEKFTKEIHRLRNVEKDLNASRTEISLLNEIKKEALAKLETTTRELASRQTIHNNTSQTLLQCQRESARMEKDIEGMRRQDTEKSKQLLNIEAEIRQLGEKASKIQKDLEEKAQAEKASLLQDVRNAEAATGNSNQLLEESRSQTLGLEQEVDDLKKKLRTQSESGLKFQEGFKSMQGEFQDAMQKSSEEIRHIAAQLQAAEEDKRLLREQNQALLTSATPKPRRQGSHSGESGRKQARMVQKAKRTSDSRSQSSSTPRRLPETRKGSAASGIRKNQTDHMKKAVVVEDSQDRSGVVEESQYTGMRGSPSSEMLLATDPITYMPKVIQDLVAAPSSPLTDPPPTPPTATEKRPTNSSSRRGRVIEDSQMVNMPSQELGGDDYDFSSQHSMWTLNETTTKTKSRSVERSIIKSSQPTFGQPSQTPNGGKTISPIHRSANVQATHRMQSILKPPPFKRTANSQSQSGESQGQGDSKRRRISSQVSTTDDGRSNAGSARPSPVKQGKLTRRKSTRQSDKYSDKFAAELGKKK